MIKQPENDGAKGTVQRIPGEPEKIVEAVRDRYGRIAEGLESGCGSAPVGASSCCGLEHQVARELGYGGHELEGVPREANMGLGCGAPVGRLELQPGEVVVDLGSGGGLDAFLAARAVGPSGRVIGVDMTPAMIERARANATKAGLQHVEFRQGRLESLPVDDDSVDAVTSNCVINLVPDKAAVFREIARVLRRGGRLVVSDIVLAGDLPEALSSDLLAYVGCVAGAMRRERYVATVEAAGLGDIEILKDVDYLAAVENALPEEVVAISERTGIRPDDVRGKVRSVTLRAWKRH